MASSSAASADGERNAAAGTAPRQPDNVILIAGGGIGGLATALALAKHGIATHVLERRDHFEEDGAGIQIGPNGTRVLAEIGVAATLKPNVARPQGLRILDGVSGKNITRLPLGTWIEECHGAPYWTLHRKDLHAALVEGVYKEPRVTVTMNADIVACKTTARAVAANASDGRSWQGTAIVAADGLHSAIRNTVVPDVEIAPSGKNAFRTVVASDEIRMRGARSETFIWLCPNAHVVHYPVRAGRQVAVIGVFDDSDIAKGWNTPVPLEWMAVRTARFPAPLRELLETATSWRKWSLPNPPHIPHVVHDRIALLGDAAHPTLPFLAQGAVMALEDAATLASCLARSEGNVREALGLYETKRLARTRAIVRASERNGRIYHMTGLMAAIRNKVLATVSPHRLLASYDWLYGWRSGEPNDHPH